MNEVMRELLKQLTQAMEKDTRCLAGWNFGSVSRGLDDQYSDIDPVFLIGEEYFQTFDAEIKDIVDDVIDDIVIFWPEVFNNEKIKNYAILFNKDDKIYQCDLTLINNLYVDDSFNKIWYQYCMEKDLLFDKINFNEKLSQKFVPKTSSSTHICYLIEKYFLYSYIMIKYYKRKKVFKSLYIMNELFKVHLEIILGKYSNEKYGSWATQLHDFVSEEDQETIKLYFCPADIEIVRRNFFLCVNAFYCEITKSEYDFDDEHISQIKRYIETKLCCDNV